MNNQISLCVDESYLVEDIFQVFRTVFGHRTHNGKPVYQAHCGVGAYTRKERARNVTIYTSMEHEQVM